VNPYEWKAPLEARVKSYLHVNCATCHVSEGGGNARMELGFTTPPGKMRLVDEVPIHDRFDIEDARLVAPGSPDRSALYRRVSLRGTGQMPPLVSTQGLRTKNPRVFGHCSGRYSRNQITSHIN
jgi:hypothetical protein